MKAPIEALTLEQCYTAIAVLERVRPDQWEERVEEIRVRIRELKLVVMRRAA